VRKVFVAALAVAIAVAGFAVVSQAGPGEAGTSWELNLKPNKVKKPASIDAVVFPSKVDDEGTADTSDDLWTPASKNTIVLPKGSKVDTSAMPRCKLTASEVGAGQQCPKKTSAGGGSATVIVGGAPEGSGGKRRGGSELSATIDAFNKKSSLLLIVQPCGPGTGPGTSEDCAPAGDPTTLEGKWSKVTTKPTLAVPTPNSLLQIGVVVKRITLLTDKKKTNDLVRTPKECGGKWKSQDQAKYVDGSSQTIKDSQKCKKPS